MQRISVENSGTSAGTTNLGALLKAKLDNKNRRVSEPVMTKSELIDRLAAQFPQLVAKDAELAVKMILDAMAESLAKGERIEIRGFGSFGLELPAAADGAQSQVRRAGAGAGKARPALQGGQGIAGARRFQELKKG